MKISLILFLLKQLNELLMTAKPTSHRFKMLFLETPQLFSDWSCIPSWISSFLLNSMKLSYLKGTYKFCVETTFATVVKEQMACLRLMMSSLCPYELRTH